MHFDKVPVYSSGDVRIEMSSYPPPETIDILSRTYYGTNGLQYRHKIDKVKVSSVLGAHFFTLFINGKAAGIFCLSRRAVSCKAMSCNAFYGRYLSILPEFAGKGYGRLLKQEAYGYVNRTFPDPFMIYSFIEEKNQRSYNLSIKQGNRRIGTYEALSFSRINPKTMNGFERMGKPTDEMLVLLKAFYQSYSLANFGYAGYGDYYFCIRKEGKIVAGVQATPVAWEIASLEGMSGKMIMHVLPHIPLLNRLFNPKHYCFVAFEAVYVAVGYEDELVRLLESALSYLKLFSGIFFGDSRCRVTQMLKASGKLGILNKVNKSVTSGVMASFYNCSVPLIDEQAILYISAFDQT